MRLQLPIFLKEAILFCLTLVLGLYTAHRYLFYLGGLPESKSFSFTFADLIILVILFGTIFFLSRHKKAAHLSFKFFLILVVFSGSQVVFGSFISSPWNLLIALIFTLLFSIGGNVFIHNLAMILGIAGIGAVLGLSISVEIGLILLVVMSLYDIIAVYVTKHMVAMARSMVEGGAIFGFLIPFEFRGFFYGKSKAREGIGQNFMILGSGDIGLPLIFVASLIKTSVSSAVIVAAFSVVGLFVTHIFFMNQRQRRAMAALPPIATMTIIGYLITVVIK